MGFFTFFKKNLLSCCQDLMGKCYFVPQPSKRVSLSLSLSFCLLHRAQTMLGWALQEEAAVSTSGFRRLFWQSDLQLGKKIIWLGFETKLWIYLHTHTDWIVNPACRWSQKRGFVNVEVKRKGLNTNLCGGQPSQTQHLSLKLFPQTSALSITMGEKKSILARISPKTSSKHPHVVTEQHITNAISPGCGLVVQL